MGPISDKNRGPVIAIDGPSGTGKSTLAKLLAQTLRSRYVDTGAMYRALALLAMEKKIDTNDPGALKHLLKTFEIRYVEDERGQRIYLMERDVTDAIRKPGVAEEASRVSRYPEVRDVLVEKQRQLAREGSVVMEGRDIGSVVLPDADLKIFLDAAEEERAKRRYLQWKKKGIDVPLEKIQEDMLVRDQRDQGRKVAPLTLAPDAVRIDTSDLNPQEALDRILLLLKQEGWDHNGCDFSKQPV